jgi:hypothetical protein
VLVAWKRHIGNTGQHRIDSHCISVQFCNDKGHLWWLTCVYGPQGDSEKIQPGNQRCKSCMPACEGPWILAGDFNLIYKASDKNKSNINRAMMGRFRRMINDLALKAIPLHGRKYTGSNQQDNPVLVKLDRCSAQLIGK